MPSMMSCRCEEQQTLLSFGQLFERHHVHAAKAFEPRAQFFNTSVAGFEIEFFRERQLASKILE